MKLTKLEEELFDYEYDDPHEIEKLLQAKNIILL